MALRGRISSSQLFIELDRKPFPHAFYAIAKFSFCLGARLLAHEGTLIILPDLGQGRVSFLHGHFNP